MARNTATASLERQTIYFSKSLVGVRGARGVGCNIDAVFIELVIAKYQCSVFRARARDGGLAE